MKLHKSNGFTMIELIFVIVVLGILTAIAVPKFAATRDDAEIASARATIAAVRSGIISERQQRMLQGNTNYIADLGANFTDVLTYPAKNWTRNSATSYSTTIAGTTCNFTYTPSTGIFKVSTTGNVCDNLDF